MTATPIFDELYAKYVAGAPARAATVPCPAAAVSASHEARRDQPASQYSGRHQTPEWPS
ncbi:hypothetical protein SAMN05216188_11540 [Lentzea xinjiangensis]|uniref:Uncharacterized protein n=1 Tax=Lentzea xinjiangensis TaxID=402600 RepID=A0A1H9RT60_9PSEU|nr:hypothetical protein [Lentzea xinjiangensis]SER75827.1 hypothetical protein SAMN05216188_11540 [Lentzea xinjiangensis]